ncbi:MAG: FAD-binding protein, partial [Thermomicrobiales bacterium]
MSKQALPESRLRVSRRGFLKSSGAGVAVAAGSIGAIPFSASRAFAQQAWDEEHDIVVVGSGGAAFAAAITAHSLGADVAMFEKGAYVGGTTLVSGGTMWTPNNSAMRAAGFTDNREDALKYMARYAFPASYNPDDAQLGLTEHDYAMLSAYYDHASAAMDLIQDAGAATWRVATNGYTGAVQADYMDHLPENTSPQGRSITTTGADGGYGGGGELIAGYQAWAEKAGVPVKLGHRVQRVVLNDGGDVIGVEIEVADAAADTTASAASATPAASPAASAAATPAAGRTIAVRARKGVIFGSGGFARNKDMMHN